MAIRSGARARARMQRGFSMTWLLAYASFSLALAVTAGVRYVGEPLERLLIGTGLLVWWPLVVLVEGADAIRFWRYQRAQRREWEGNATQLFGMTKVIQFPPVDLTEEQQGQISDKENE